MTLNDFQQFESYLNEKLTLNDSAAPLHIIIEGGMEPFEGF